MADKSATAAEAPAERALLYIPAGFIASILSTINDALAIGSKLGGRLNGKLVRMKRPLVEGNDDFSDANARLIDEFTKYIDDPKNAGQRIKAPVYIKDPNDPSGATPLYRRDAFGNVEFADDATTHERKPIPIVDPNGVQLTDPAAFMREQQTLSDMDVAVDFPMGLLTDAELLVIGSHGSGAIVDGLKAIADGSPFTKQKSERDAARDARRETSPLFARFKRVADATPIPLALVPDDAHETLHEDASPAALDDGPAIGEPAPVTEPAAVT